MSSKGTLLAFILFQMEKADLTRARIS